MKTFTLPGFFLFIFLLVSVYANAGLPEEPENLAFEVNVFGVVKALEVAIEFSKGQEKDQYIGTLKIKPQGMLRMVVPFSHSEMISTMRKVPGTNRLRLEHMEKQTKSKRLYRGVYAFDYAQGRLTGQGFFDGKPLAPEVFEIPQSGRFYYDDLLTFLYNVRSGGYGELKPGERVLVNMLPGKGNRTFELEFIGESTAKTRKDVAEKKMVTLHLNREFYGLKISEMRIWLSSEDSPLRGLAKNVLGWGDVALISTSRS